MISMTQADKQSPDPRALTREVTQMLPGKASFGALDPGDDLLALAALICSNAFVLFTTKKGELVWFCEGVRVEASAGGRMDDPFHDWVLRSGSILEVPDASRDERFNSRILRINGKSLLFYAGIPIVAADGEVIATLAVLDVSPRDLTPSQRSALVVLGRMASFQLTLDHQLAATFDQAPIGIAYADREGIILRSNPSFYNLLGLGLHQSSRLSLQELIYDADRSSNVLQYQRLWSRDINLIDQEMRLVGAGGRTVWVRATIALMRHADETSTCAFIFTRDISARKDLAEALLDSKQLLETVIADIPLAVRACDAEGNIFLHNRAAAEFFALRTDTSGREGLRSAMEGEVKFFLPDGTTPVPNGERPLPRALRGEPVMQMEMILARAGEPRRITRTSARRLTGAHGECLGAVAVTTDVTQIQRLARERAHSQKLESIGELSAGIAHEINTPTQFIGNNVAFLKDSVTEIFASLRAIESLVHGKPAAIAVTDIEQILAALELSYLYEEVPKALEQSIDGIARIQTIVGAMKEFSHPATEKTSVDINRAIRSTIIVASNEWKYVAEVKTDLAEELPSVNLMPGSFNQVILNMIVNAAHAIAPVAQGTGARGVITVSTRQIENCVEICIEDTGSGIPESIRNRIFDPFFTTKPVGKGTGQGLAIAHDVIVKKHGGTIDVESTVGQGTRFVLRLPLTAEPS